MFAVITKKRILIIILILILVISSSIALEFVSLKEAETVPSIGITVVIDPGHGGVDPGSVGKVSKVKESELNLKISLKLAKMLKSVGIAPVLTRSNANGLYGLYSKGYKKRDMEKRKEIIKSSNPDMVVSIHMNAYPRSALRGAQVFYDAGSEISRDFAQSIQDQFAYMLPASDKGISTGDYFMLKCTNSPSIICECGFLSNAEDEKLLNSDDYQEKIAYSIFCGIVAFLNLPY